MDINTVDGATMKTYIYADSQILAQHDGNSSDPRYFYLHDRLGSIREIIDTDGDVVNSYTYDPFGESFDTECAENVSNPFKFTGQWFDSEIEQYYLRARQYDPALMRFTERDPVNGKYQEPLTLHKYLYCNNDSINKKDPSGEFWGYLFSAEMRVKLAGAAFGAQIVATHLINTLNIRAMMMAIHLQNFTLESAVMLSNKVNQFAEIAQVGGIRAIAAVSQLVAQYTTLHTFEDQMTFIYASLGIDPASPSVYAQQLGMLIHQVGMMWWEEYGDEATNYWDWDALKKRKK